MTQLHLLNQSFSQKPRLRPNVRVTTLQIGPSFLIFTLVAMVCLISLVTLTFSTSGITKGYALKKLEAEHELLLRDHEAKTMHVAEVRSLAMIKASAKVQSMTWPKQVVYFRGDTAIAAK